MTIADKLLRLDIGSADVRVREDYTTVDLYAPEADVKADMGELPFPDGSVDEIWASHCLEHVTRERVPSVLAEWLRVLAPGRPAIIAVPNMDYAARYWLHGPDRDRALQMIYGDPPYEHHLPKEGAVHQMAWSPKSLRDDLEAAGFEIVSVQCIFETQDNVEGSFVHEMETIRAEVKKPEH